METVTIAKAEYEAFKAEAAELKLLIKWYEQQLLSLRRRQFGVSSERTAIAAGQLNLFENEEAAPPPEPETEEINYTRKKRKGKREEDLSGLEAERIDYALSETERACPECGEPMRGIGVQIRRELTLIPAKVVVRERASHTYACRSCERNGVTVPFSKAESPAPPFKRLSGIAVAGSAHRDAEIRKRDAAVPAGERVPV